MQAGTIFEFLICEFFWWAAWKLQDGLLSYQMQGYIFHFSVHESFQSSKIFLFMEISGCHFWDCS